MSGFGIQAELEIPPVLSPLRFEGSCSDPLENRAGLMGVSNGLLLGVEKFGPLSDFPGLRQLMDKPSVWNRA